MAASFCGSCGAPASPGGSFCPRCGASYATPSIPTPAQTAVAAPAPAGAMPVPTHVVPAKPRVTQGMAIAALILNLLIWPGLGSLVAGRQVGWAQGFIFLAGIPLTILLVGIPMLVGAWIWALVTGIQLVQESGQPA